jgi:hypothetical protein
MSNGLTPLEGMTILAVGAVLSGIGFVIYMYYQERKEKRLNK